jgi:hypothetical protein
MYEHHVFHLYYLQFEGSITMKLRDLLEQMPECERCHKQQQALGWFDGEHTTRYYDVPPWCSECVVEGSENGDLDTFWLEQVKRDYESGKLQS